MKITAYLIEDAKPLPLVPAKKKRAFHKDIKGISLCLPLQIANQWGWWLINPVGFTVTRYDDELHIIGDKGEKIEYAKAHFGFGVMTVFVPYIFRTPPGWNTQLRGPSNYVKWGIMPFEGIVETSWHNATATMNWLLQKNASVHFAMGEPLCQIVPVPAMIEAWEPSIAAMPDDMREEYKAWSEQRNRTIQDIYETGKPRYEGSYKAIANNKLSLSPWTSG